MLEKNTYDVIIAGGGVMGCATAYYLLKADPALQVAVFEKDSSYRFNSSFCDIASELCVLYLCNYFFISTSECFFSCNSFCKLLSSSKCSYYCLFIITLFFSLSCMNISSNLLNLYSTHFQATSTFFYNPPTLLSIPNFRFSIL